MFCQFRVPILIIYLFQFNGEYAIELSSKVDFGNPTLVSNYKAILDSEVFTRRSPDRQSLTVYPKKSKDIIFIDTENVKQISGEEFSDEIPKENIICKPKKCTVTIDNISAENDQKKKISTDVHVIISTDVDSIGTKKQRTDSDENNDSEIPVFKGYTGVNPEDINWNDEEDTNEVKNDEQPSSIITDGYSGRPVIIDNNEKPEKPWDHLLLPNKPAENWRTGDWKTVYDSSESPAFPNYGSSESNDRGVRLPSGWSSNWRPVVPMARTPTDYFHYNVNGNGNDFSGWNPHFRTVCSCERKPVYANGKPRIAPIPRNPWYPAETTTKIPIDDKLSPPFSVNKQNNK